MKTQISNHTDQPGKRYSGVYQQQGRMILDADSNELNEIIKRSVRDALRDIIGSGTPDNFGVLRQDATGEWKLHWGRLYADGQAADLSPDPDQDPAPTEFTYTAQADFPDPPALPTGVEFGYYADLWERAVTSLEDDALLDPAFAGADTATRTQTMAQVKWAPVGTNPANPDTNPPIGTAVLSVAIRDSSSGTDACDPCADELSLDVDVGSYLFRVEIHDVYDDGSGNAVVFLKWSSENGAEQYFHGDRPQGFEGDDWAYEVFSKAPGHESEKLLGIHLATGFIPTRGRVTRVYPTSITNEDPVRRWDGYCRLVQTGSEWALLEESGDDGGTDRGVTLSDSAGDDIHGRVRSTSGSVAINLKSLAITLNLADKRLVAGDYWLVPVRGAIHSAGDSIAEAKLPDGILHRYLPLAGVAADGTLTPLDLGGCKSFDFPPLTDLNASDICYIPDDCVHTESTNVQDALTALCQANDVADHNKHLHGCGVVCGYKVHCAGPDEPEVLITSGYAILPDGTVLKTDNTSEVPVVALADGLLDANDTGVVVLHVTRGAAGEPKFEVIADYNRPSPFTIWQDFLAHCILPIIERLKELFGQFQSLFAGEQPEGDNPLAIAVFNLFCQDDPFNIPKTEHVYLSLTEHRLLSDFYDELQSVLGSKTSCAQHTDHAFPDYPFEKVPMDTLFGWGAHTRIRTFQTSSDLVNRMIFTCGGASDTIHVYDADTRELLASLVPSALEGLAITDIAVTVDGKRLYAVAQRNDDTLLAWATIDTHKFDWTDVLNICDYEIRTIIPDSRSRSTLYGSAIGKALVRLQPDALLNAADPKPEHLGSDILASGHIVEDRVTRRLLATHMQLGNNAHKSGKYTTVRWYDLGSHAEDDITISSVNDIFRDGSDGLTDGLIPIGEGRSEGEGKRPGFYLAVDPSRNNSQFASHKAAFGFYATDDGYECVNRSTPLRVPDTVLGLGYHFAAERLLVTAEDRHALIVTYLDEPLKERVGIPVQVGPVGVAITHAKDEQFVAVLNNRSNTVTLIESSELVQPTLDRPVLQQYRLDMLAAFKQIIQGVTDALRDCFCDLLLPECGACGKDELVTLARIEIHAGHVEHICNLSRRKFLKTWPTIEYWLSSVGLFGTIGQWVARLCCPEEDDLLSKLAKNPLGAAGRALKGFDLRDGEAYRSRQQGYAWNMRAKSRTKPTAWKQGMVLLEDNVIERIAPSTSGRKVIAPDAVIDASVNDAETILRKRGVEVIRVLDYDPAVGANAAIKFGFSAPTLRPGTPVTLYQRDGKIVYYETPLVAPLVTPAVILDKTSDAIRALEGRRDQLMSNLDKAGATVSELTSTQDAVAEQIQFTKVGLEALSADRTALRDEVQGVKTEIEELRLTREDLTNGIDQAKTEMAALEAHRTAIVAEVAHETSEMRANLNKEMAPYKSITSLESVDASRAALLKLHGILFIGQVAELSRQELAQVFDNDAAAAREVLRDAQRFTTG